MKNILFICLSLVFGLFTQELIAQAPPQKMTYQFVARNAQNQLIQNNAVGLRISILQGSPTGTAVYVETHTPQTNGNGTATIEVGGGTVVSGVFANIDWSTGVYFIQTEMDPQGQQGYSVTAVSQLLSVPYAFYAGRATYADSVSGGMSETDPTFNASVAAAITAADTARWNQDLVDDADNDPTNELQTLSVVGNTISLSNGGGSVTLTERDSIFTNSLAAGITAADTARWNGGWIVAQDTVYTYKKVGIGTNSPPVLGNSTYSELTVESDWSIPLTLTRPNGPNTTTRFINQTDTAFIGNNLNGNFAIGFDANLFNAPFQVTPNFNVGIGTTNPTSKLHIVGGDLQIENVENQARFVCNNFGLIHRNDGLSYYILLTNSGDPYGAYNNLRPLKIYNNTGNVNLGFNTLYVEHGGNVGIGGTTTPNSKLEVLGGDVYINNITSGVVMKSPNGNCWRVTVDNTGNLVRTAIACP